MTNKSAIAPSKDAVERAAVLDGSKRSPNMRPKDAATLIILDGEGPNAKMLMGRRHEKHKFMPGLFVFPGGRVDRTDGSAPALDDLNDHVAQKIINNLRAKPTARRARALALAAIRETYEEAGLFLGERAGHKTGISAIDSVQPDWQAFQQEGITPTLAPLRLLARAITPPGRTRRFDAWFFITHTQHIAHRLPQGTGPSGELQDLHWLTIEEALKLELPVITVSILQDLKQRLADDPALKPASNIPFYHLKGKNFLRELI